MILQSHNNKAHCNKAQWNWKHIEQQELLNNFEIEIENVCALLTIKISNVDSCHSTLRAINVARGKNSFCNKELKKVKLLNAWNYSALQFKAIAHP